MKGVYFGGLHSFYEWGLILSEKEIKAPQQIRINICYWSLRKEYADE